MKNFEVKFSLFKNLGLSLLLLVFAIEFTPISLYKLEKIESWYIGDTIMSICTIVLYGLIFFYLRRALYRKAVISVNEKGIQLTYFYNVFIPWEDIEHVRLIASSFGNSSKLIILIIMLKDNEKYVKEYLKGISKIAMQIKIRKYLSPVVIDARLFETRAESVQELLEKGLEEYRAKAASV